MPHQIASAPFAAADPLAVALGYVNWNYHYPASPATGVAATQVIFASSIYLPPGKTITNINLQVLVAGVATAPTSFFVGLCSASKMLAQSANIIGGANEGQLKAIGTATLPLSATYTTNTADSPSGAYYIAVLQNGAYATPVQFGRVAGVSGAGVALAGNSPIFGTLGSGQTALAANGAAVTVTANTATFFGVACS